MRELFISERRYIDNILWKWAKVRVEPFGPVVIEEYSPPRTKSRVRFNNDFLLQFVSREERLDLPTEAFGSPILTNTLGVDVFLLVHAQTLQPLRTELLGGEGFEMRHFKEHIDTIEKHLANLSCPINLRRTKYCRIFVIENNICFLAFPNHLLPVSRGERTFLSADDDSTIACALDGDEIVYVDGWIRTHVPESEWKLEAVPVESADELPEGLLSIEPNDIDFDNSE